MGFIDVISSREKKKDSKCARSVERTKMAFGGNGLYNGGLHADIPGHKRRNATLQMII